MITYSARPRRWYEAALGSTGFLEGMLLLASCGVAFCIVVSTRSMLWFFVSFGVGMLVTEMVSRALRGRAARDVATLPDVHSARAERLVGVLFGNDASVHVQADRTGPFRIEVHGLDGRQCSREDQRAWISTTVDVSVPGRWQTLWQADCRAVTFERIEEPQR